MLFWVLCAVLTAAVLYFVTRPLTVPVAGPSALERDRASDLAVYRDQLSEVEADRARGLLSDAEAEAARIEISRRLLARAESGEPAQGGSGERGLTGARMAFITAVILVPAVSLALYLAYGSPGLPGRPHAERVAASADKASIETLVAKVEERLRAHPEDGQGWDVIAPVYFRQGRFDEAVQAYRNAIRLLGESPKRLAGLGEAQVFAKNGIVTEDARRAFQRLAELEPSRPEPRFWLALAKEQDGDIGGALADYRKLVADAPADADWRAPVEQRIAMLTQRRAGDPRDEAERGPTEQDIAAAGKLAPGERAAMIEQMVEGLAQRLETESQDLAGWQRLMRAYAVLGQKDKANDALAKARKAFAEDETSLAALNDLARKLGLDS
jgi:cytochrome c-type biogenesis protein CcmH